MKKPVSRTAPGLLAEMAVLQPDCEFIVDGGVRFSYASFQRTVADHAKGLYALGLRRGGRLAILMDNRHEWLTAYFAAMQLGAEVVALNSWATGSELAYQLRHADVEFLVAEGNLRGRALGDIIADIRLEGGNLACLSNVIAVDGAPEGGWIDFADLPALGRDAPVIDPPEPDDIACILYTSGSTATPKGVPLLHRGLIDNSWEIGERMHLTPADRLWLAISLFWSFGCVNALFTTMTHGGTIVLQHRFDAGAALKLIARERCTVFYGLANMAQAMAEHSDRARFDLTSLRTGATIGTPAQIQTIVDLGVDAICNVYGLTEAYGNSAVSDALAPLEQRLRSCGQPLAGVSIRIVDPESGAALPAGEIGEIAIRGRLTPGYLYDPEKTAASLDADGYLLTGDLGFLDPGGNLVFSGRLTEMVKTGGINVAPAEIEAVLARHDCVEQAYVTAIPDPRLDEAVAAVIVARPGTTPDPDDLAAHCRRSLAAYKIPRHYRIVAAGDLPLTATGKLAKNRLPDLFVEPHS